MQFQFALCKQAMAQTIFKLSDGRTVEFSEILSTYPDSKGVETDIPPPQEYDNLRELVNKMGKQLQLFDLAYNLKSVSQHQKEQAAIRKATAAHRKRQAAKKSLEDALLQYRKEGGEISESELREELEKLALQK